MKNRIHILFIVLGIALMTVPLFFDLHDRNQAERYIERLEDGTKAKDRKLKPKTRKRKNKKVIKRRHPRNCLSKPLALSRFPTLISDIRRNGRDTAECRYRTFAGKFRTSGKRKLCARRP